jgi:limonene-1,2-epoxide hydrolase
MHPTIQRLVDAMNRHDADGMASCFAATYDSEQPVHPNRTFRGPNQVAKNWRQMFAGVPDVVVQVVSSAQEGSTTWTEYAWDGHYTDGSTYAARGCIVAGVDDDGLIAWQRLYMEPVEENSADIEEAVRQLSTPKSR